MRSAIFCLASVSFAVYALAVARFFARPDGIQPRMRIVSVSGSLNALVHLAWLGLGPLSGSRWQELGLAVYAVGLALFIWTWRLTRLAPPALAFSLTMPTRIFTSGPYAVLNHPFYTWYSLTWFAGVVATGSLALGVSAAWMVTLYVIAARVEKRHLLASAVAHLYLNHRRRLWIRPRARRGCED